MELESSFSNYKENFFLRWRKSILTTSWIVAVLITVVEIFTYYTLLTNDERVVVNTKYIITRIITPSFLNFGTLTLITIAQKMKRISIERKNFLVSFGMFMICSVISIFHNYFQILLLSTCVSLFICTIFGNIKILNVLEIATVPVFITSGISFWFDELTGTPIYKLLTILCAIVFIFCSYLFAKSIVNSQKDQLSYIQNSYKKQSELIEELRIDPLTKLYNRIAFSETICRIITLSKESKVNPYLVMIDIDFFKKVNDKYGHIAGDEVLTALADIMKDNISSRKTFRFGGEEFILLFEDATEQQVVNVVSKIRKDFNNKHYDFAVDSSFTISAGISGLSPSFDDKAWIENADKALYFAKENGRDQIKIAEF